MTEHFLPRDPVIRAETNALGIRRVPGYHVYVVRWPDGVTKAGIASYPSRWRGYETTGGELLALLSSDVRFLDGIEERLHDAMALRGPRAFQSAAEAIRHLPAGAGWTECYLLDEPGFSEFAMFVRVLARTIERGV